ncbi:UDP-3-O-(3-hydroxymyristoyl)glucosamine N-acyltransferase [Halotalea alkalilenta]|uniref:UDP-3-O-acylglucosamine N-acyltransferase n=1 Tax=Halotalea alkalilenta TaxID=376489 RepID=A0A172YJV5_9GAMM|nr:UDP-3-O-(3-hydroxymyristoyl)glucosamine N-acyltransferase [Halotalea alkalilenta]ANF59504.1 UDP-3-O-(3-hydroxymyristoyl)glucosamine N-acyltransferase [Halotalea alkalilenta]
MKKTATIGLSLNELASLSGATLRGDGERQVTGFATLVDAGPDDIAFLANPAYLKHLAGTRAAAVLLRPEHVEACPTNALALDNPYLGYAKLSSCFDRFARATEGGVHPTAVISDSAVLGEGVSVGPQVVIGDHVRIGARVRIGAGSVIGDDCEIGEDGMLHANVTLYHGVMVGARAIIHSGAVLGGDGFGFAHDGRGWQKIAQIGGVVVGDDVEIGSCTSIDRGALGDTVIGDDVKIDSQVQIAHNVHIGDHSALAGCVGIAGSTRVGRGCLLGGGVGLAGHLEIADRVQVTGMSLVTNSILEPGVYSSGTGAMPNALWRKNAVRFKQLDALARRVSKLEKS